MSYTGKKVTFLAGQGGFNGSENFDAIPYTDLVEAKNIRYDGNAWRKAGGLALFDANAVVNTPNCVGGFDWWPLVTLQKQVTAWANGIVYKEAAGDVDGVELVNSLTLNSAPVIFVAGGAEIAGNNRKLFAFNKVTPPQVLNANGATMANIANFSIDWSANAYPMGAVAHDGRLIAWRNHEIYASSLSNHENFLRYDPANAASDILPTFTIMGGDGEEIRSCYSMGTTRLYIMKYPTGIYFIDTQNITSLFMPVTTVRTDIGIGGPRGVTSVGSLGHWFIGSDGHIYSLEMLQNPDVDLKDASPTQALLLGKWIKDNVNLSNLLWSQLIYDPNRKEVIAYYSQGSGTTNNIGLVFDVRDPNNIKIAEENRGQYFNAAWHAKEATTQYRNIYVAGTGGFVYKTNNTNRRIGASTGYSASLKIPDTDLGFLSPELATLKKRFDWFELFFGQTTGTAYIDTYIDGQFYQTYTADLGGAGALLGSTFVLGTSTLFSPAIARTKIKIGGIGEKFGFKIRNSIANHDFLISRATVYFQLLGTTGEK